MSVVPALERIKRWAEQHDPEFVALLQPGLSRQEIDALVGGSPFALAEEVYELYQWHNGQDDGPFRLGLVRSGQYPFMPLTQSLDQWRDHLEESYRDEVENRNPLAALTGGWPPADSAILEAGGWLPLFRMDSDFHVSLGVEAGAATAPITYVPRYGRSAIFYASLTARLNFTADIYESGALRSDDEMGDFFDYTIGSAVQRKHFPSKVAQAEEAYKRGQYLSHGPRSLSPDRPNKEELEQFALVSKLVRSGSQEAAPAAEEFLSWLLGDVEQARQITQGLVHHPCIIMREWPHKRSLLVNNLTYSFLII